MHIYQSAGGCAGPTPSRVLRRKQTSICFASTPANYQKSAESKAIFQQQQDNSPAGHSKPNEQHAGQSSSAAETPQSASVAPESLQSPAAVPITHAAADEDEYETIFVTESVTEDAADVGTTAVAQQHINAAGGTGMPRASAMASMQLSQLMGPAPGTLQYSVNGWVVAAALLAAVRFSRQAADEERLDTRALQARQAESRLQSAELRALRAQYLEAEAKRKEAEAAKRLAEAKRRAEEEAAAAAVREAEYKAEQAREAERQKLAQEAARKLFVERGSRLAEELAARTESEKRALVEAEAARKAEEEQRRVEEAAARARAAAEAEARAAAEAARRAAEAAARERERAQVAALRTMYAISLQGSVTVEPAPPQTFTTSSSYTNAQGVRVPKLARYQVSLRLGLVGQGSMVLPPGPAPPQSAGSSAMQPPGSDAPMTGSSTGGTAAATGSAAGSTTSLRLPSGLEQEQYGAYESSDAAVEGASALAAEVARPLLEKLWTDGMQEAGGAHGPGSLMDHTELGHWRRLALAACEAAGVLAVGQVAPLAGSDSLSQDFKVEVRRAALPRGHPSRVNGRLSAAAAFAAEGQGDQAVTLVERVIEDEEEMAGGGLGPLPPLTLQSLVWAHFLERATAASAPAPDSLEAALGVGSTSLSSVGDGGDGLAGEAGRIVRSQLSRAARRVGLDGLTPTARCLSVALGPSHPVTTLLSQLAEANMSLEARQRANVRKQQAELEVATAALRAQDPRRGAMDPGDPRTRKALTPVPEQLWAVRNVANGFVRFGDQSKMGEAVRMLSEACDLAREHYGPTHPAGLAPLLDLQDALTASIALAESAAGAKSASTKEGSEAEELRKTRALVTGRILAILQAIAERYTEQHDSLSVIVLYEAAVRDLEGVAGTGNAELSAMAKEANNLMYTLTPAEARVAMSKRPQAASSAAPPPSPPTSSLLRALAKEFTQELGVYSASRKPNPNSRFEQWTKHAPLTPLR